MYDSVKNNHFKILYSCAWSRKYLNIKIKCFYIRLEANYVWLDKQI